MIQRCCHLANGSAVALLVERHIVKHFFSRACFSSQRFENAQKQGDRQQQQRGLVRFSSIPKDDLGDSILYWSDPKNKSSPKGQHEFLRKGVIIAKIMSLSSSALGLVMVPVLTKYVWEAAAERPSIMAFAVVANFVLALLSLTPFLLQFLVKRFIIDIFYNSKTKMFTTVHYGFWINKRALRFHAEDVVDAAVAPEMKRLWLPLATAFVNGRPLLVSLDINGYKDREAFIELTKNVVIPPGSD